MVVLVRTATRMVTSEGVAGFSKRWRTVLPLRQRELGERAGVTRETIYLVVADGKDWAVRRVDVANARVISSPASSRDNFPSATALPAFAMTSFLRRVGSSAPAQELRVINHAATRSPTVILAG